MSDTAPPTSSRPRDVPGVRLSALSTAGITRRGTDVTVTGVAVGSADVRPGDLFAALPGARSHGAAYTDQARAAGAVAVLTDPDGSSAVPDDLPLLIAANPRAVLGAISADVYGHPTARLAVAGITGTSGKTTTSFLVRAGLGAVGRPAGLVGTVGTFLGEQELPAKLTTPEAPQLQAVFALMLERGLRDAVMEVSSHALVQGRVDGTEFAVGAFTNLSRDHLDFHRDMEHYFAAKAMLFDGRARRCVVVVDDEWGRLLAARLGPALVSVAARPHGPPPHIPATWTARDVQTAADGTTRFTAIGPVGEVPAGCRIPGRYNVANVLLALAVLHELGVDVQRAVPAVAAAQVPGRMERIEAGQPYLAVVDYAHKPAAVAGALRAARALTTGRLIVVLGCGGDRDRDKRPIMGEVAARAADVLIVTDDNPRSEVAATIRAAVVLGASTVPVGQRAEVHEIGDRAEAITTAVALALPGDCIIVAGKGHERGQEVAGHVWPFDDRVELRAALAEAGWSA